MLEARMVRLMIGIQRYATPLIQPAAAPKLKAPAEAVMANLRRTERRLSKDPKTAVVYINEIYKLEAAGYVKQIPPETVNTSTESWYLPHHLVHHNGKAQLVFNSRQEPRFKYFSGRFSFETVNR